MRGLALVVLAALVLATVVEALDALGALTPGPEPGDTPWLVDAATLLGILASLAGIAVAAAATRVAPFVAPLAAAFLVARFESYDAYYAPALRRMSDGGVVSPWVVASLLCAALAVGTAALRWRAARPVAAPVLFAIAAVAAFASAGH